MPLQQCLCLSSRRLPDAGKEWGGWGINLLSFRCRHHPDQRQEHLCNDEEHYNFNLVIGLSTIYTGDEKKKEKIYEI